MNTVSAPPWISPESWSARSRSSAPLPTTIDIIDEDTPDSMAHDVFDIMLEGGLMHECTEMVSCGVRISPDQFSMTVHIAGHEVSVVDPRKVVALISAGKATLAVHGMDRWMPGGLQICRNFYEATSRVADLSMYVTPEGGSGLARHFDPQNVILYQTRGTKRWSLWKSALDKPLTREDYINRIDPQYSETPDIEIDLREGQALFIPQGWGHSAHAESFSVHLTFGYSTSGGTAERQPRARELFTSLANPYIGG